ncbi:MAG: hypothetical protein ACEY3M_22345 [Wolbachia sp.]
MSSTGMTPFWMEISVSYLHDIILFPGSQCLGTGMTGEGGYWDNRLA